MNNPVLNANAIDKPVSISGVDLIITHAIYLGLPNTPSIIAEYACIGSFPAINNAIAPTNKPKTIDIKENKIVLSTKEIFFLLALLLIIFTSCHH